MAGSGGAHLRAAERPVLAVEDLEVRFAVGRGQEVHAVSGLSFDLLPGETLGIVGESGCGKSTSARAIMRLVPASGGSVRLEGEELLGLPEKQVRRRRLRMQMIFQDAVSSLNPRRTVRALVAEGAAMWNRPMTAGAVDELLASVGLDPALVGHRRPHELSGGQCQRVAIARALALNPAVLVCDEPVSALDVSVQAQILNLLHDARERYGLATVFISHDLAVVKNISDRMLVMYLGKVCEVGDVEEVHREPAHPYTRFLGAAVPEPDPDAPIPPDEITGELPSPLDPPSGCRFRTRCPLATQRCADEEPRLRTFGHGRAVACHYPLVGGVA
ncbi:ATP-binding cassette domain-containing protein [Phytohabitans sp. ZYX-F-186]|uniref:ATP-binding cassette domain-containing protein n=1 Tax=Phytohabitans maris TaxID=3071409 RepID=A0ABU0ZBK2_9ACTN|nr:oligopeptide/dipeptide ABC transporter ATP-binding protein [Phytohabitans sp. ZYX-F-186]MDQ7903710.1 ATP-binding cassette domain-containing protein [Phytohabitans sp. ZYX-F-186]